MEGMTESLCKVCIPGEEEFMELTNSMCNNDKELIKQCTTVSVHRIQARNLGVIFDCFPYISHIQGITETY